MNKNPNQSMQRWPWTISLFFCAAFLSSTAQAQDTAQSVTQAATPEPRFLISLGAAAGYGGITVEDEAEGHGALIDASLSLAWGNPRWRKGLRFHATYSPNLTLTNDNGEAFTNAGLGVHGSYYQELGGFWLAPGGGLYVLRDPEKVEANLHEPRDIFEFYLAAGYSLRLHRFISVEIAAEMGTNFFQTLRYQGTAGLKLTL